MGWVADKIVNEYRREQAFKKKYQRQNCKEKECEECNLNDICEDKEIIDEENQ